MSLLQTEKLPAPIAIDGVVVADVVARTLGVRLSETASGYQRLWWKQAHVTCSRFSGQLRWFDHAAASVVVSRFS